MTRSVNLVLHSVRRGWATCRYRHRHYASRSLNEIRPLPRADGSLVGGADRGQPALRPFPQRLASAWLCGQRAGGGSVSNRGVGEPPMDEKHTGSSPAEGTGGKDAEQGQTPAPHLGKETNTREMIRALAREAEERLSHEGRAGICKPSSQDTPAFCGMVMGEEGRSVWAFGMKVTVKCPGENTGESYSLMEYILAPGDGWQMHTHNKEDETWYVLEGGLEWKLGDRSFTASKGCFIHLPKGIPHSFHNNSTEPARMLVSCFPAGFENYLLEVGLPADSEQNAAKPTTTTEDAKIAIHAGRKYGVIFGH